MKNAFSINFKKAFLDSFFVLVKMSKPSKRYQKLALVRYILDIPEQSLQSFVLIFFIFAALK